MNGYGQNNSHKTGLLSPFTEFVRSLKGIILQHLVSGLGARARETLGIMPSMSDYPGGFLLLGEVKHWRLDGLPPLRLQALATGHSVLLIKRMDYF